MAQIDTGMGWEAKDAWLMNSAGIMGYLRQVSIPGDTRQPIPKTNPEISDVINSDFILCEYIKSGTHHIVYAGANSESVVVGRYTGQYTARRYHRFCTADVGAEVYIVDIPDGQSPGMTTVSLSSYDTATALYYSDWVLFLSGSGQMGYTDYVPFFSSANELMASVTSSNKPYYKLNPGYAVACFCTWITPEGTTQISPVLISTNEEYVKLSENGTDESPYTYTSIQLLDGVTFYMSMFINLPGGIGTLYVPSADLQQFAAAAPKKVFKLLANESFANIVILNSPDPYEEDDGSEEGGGDGEEDEEDPVDFTDPPSTAIGATGFLTIFTPSLGQLQNLAYFMWNSFDIDNWRRLFANPMDAILGLHIIPVPPYITGTKTVKVAGISTEIEMDYTSVRYIPRPMGTCEIPKKWGAYLDYNPYTKVSIFLPYIGFKDLDADDIMGKTIALQYIIDILTGACVVELKCGDTVLYSWQGNCANEVPITGGTWRGAIASALGIAGTIAKTALTGGASAPMIAGTIASVGANSLNLKPSVDRSGAIAGSAGFMGSQRPYIIRTVPNLVIPNDQNKMIGYPSFVNASLGSLTGYNEISAIHLEGIPATGNELSEIETLLKGGVIF